ncbi:hypothetical protein B0J11DRAFT_576839 [Dendryphion nanum]|uniref:Uncharacterized protein n=1 Tax=Dendryphion nanum TaxID=256645 RepID=A0A9P9E3W1_9PLEO|nr:hypothetical protein B0J11DRAFT_576839 [Dendryphion nanum]
MSINSSFELHFISPALFRIRRPDWYFILFVWICVGIAIDHQRHTNALDDINVEICLGHIDFKFGSETLSRVPLHQTCAFPTPYESNLMSIGDESTMMLAPLDRVTSKLLFLAILTYDDWH